MNKIFLITIDTEGDNLWNKTKDIKTENLRYLTRFQELCVKYGFKPTYFVNYEAVNDKQFVDDCRGWVKDGDAEVGMHIHGWNSPPYFYRRPLNYQNFLIEEPLINLKKKVRVHLDLLNEYFQVQIKSHRAGRWAINAEYLSVLKASGITSDSSITPYLDWGKIDNQYLKNGINYSHFKNSIYKYSKSNLVESIDVNENDLIELPTSIYKTKMKIYGVPLLGKVFNKFRPEFSWIRPNGRNLKEMKSAVTSLEAENVPYIMFMTHSSELMPGGSPYFKSEKSIEILYDQLELFFAFMREKNYSGKTITNYRNTFSNDKK